MKFQEISERCWTGYRQVGMKKKGERQVPNCVPVEENQASPERNTAKSLAQDLKGWIDDYQEIQAAGLDSNNINYIRKLKRNIETAHEQIRRLGYRFDANNPDLVRLMGRSLGEVKTGPEMTLNDLLYTAAAKAMHDAGLEGIPMDYEEAIKKAAKIYRIPYTPSELPKLLAQRDEIDRKLAMLKQGKQVAKARRQERLAPTPAGSEEWHKAHALTVDRIKPPSRTLEEYTGDPFIDNAARELLGFVLMFGVPFAVGTYVTLRNKLRKYEGREIIDALERKGVTMNRQTYEKVKPVLDRFDQAIRDDDGTEARALAKQIEQMIIMGKLSSPETRPADTTLAAKEKELAEDLRKWFKEKWVRFGPDGKIRGDCARGSSKEGKPKCLPQAKAHALGKKGRASAAAKKRREDPNAERRGPARNVATKVREGNNNDDWYDDADEFGMPGSEFFPEKQPRGHYKVYYMTATDHKLMGRYATQDEAEQRVRELKADYPDNKFIVFASQRGMHEAQTDYQKRRQRERDIDAGRPVKPVPKSPKTDYQKRREQQRRDMEMGEEAIAEGFEYGNRVQHPKYGAGQVIQVYSNGMITVNFPNYPDPIDKKPGVQPTFGPGDKDYQSLKPLAEAEAKTYYRVIYNGRPLDMLFATMQQAQMIAKRLEQEHGGKARVDHTVDMPKDLVEKQDACYRKVKSRYKVWPSAYASGALVQCRKKGAANWGNKGKKK